MSDGQLDVIIGLLNRLVEQTKEPETKTVVVVNPATVEEKELAKIAEKAVYHRVASEGGLATRTPIKEIELSYEDYGGVRPIRGATRINAVSLVPDLDAISINGGRTYDMVVDVEYLEDHRVTLTTDAGYTITCGKNREFDFKPKPGSERDE